MINQVEIPMYLEEALPEMPHDLLVSKENSPYNLLEALSTFTCRNIQDHDYKAIKRSFKIADMLYSKGNDIVKNAVANVFVFSFTRIFQTYPGEKKRLLSLLPMTLYTIYISQVCHKGC